MRWVMGKIKNTGKWYVVKHTRQSGSGNTALAETWYTLELTTKFLFGLIHTTESFKNSWGDLYKHNYLSDAKFNADSLNREVLPVLREVLSNED
jgi:hypothetical protein